MLSAFNRLASGCAELCLRPWEFESPWPALIAASLFTAGLLVVLFQFSSNQQALQRRRNRFIARVMELQLYRHDLRVSFSACGRILWANLHYVREFMRPVLAGLLPMLLIFTHLAGWFEHRPLRPGETAVLEVELDAAHPVLQTPVTVTASEQANVDSPAVRIPAGNDMAWRVRANELGQGWVDVRVGDLTERKTLAVEQRLVPVSTTRPRLGTWSQVVSPAEAPLAVSSPIVRMELTYPARELLLGDHAVHWTVAAVVLMMSFGLALGWLFGVRVA